MDVLARFAIPGIVFLLTLVFGAWLSRSGKPYNGILFNIHKLTALGAVIITVVQLTRLLKNIDARTLVVVLLAAAAVGGVALFASGALMSISVSAPAGKVDYPLMLTIHRLALLVVVIAMPLAVYLLGRRL